MEIRDIVSESGDWHWLYINGVSQDEDGCGHELEVDAFCECINNYLNGNSYGSHRDYITKIDFKRWYVSQEYAENGLPINLSDIPDDVYV